MSDDHDPDVLDALAQRMEAAADLVEAESGRLAPGPRAASRRLMHEARDGAALIRRLAGDLRIVARLLQEARLLAPDGPEE